MSARVVLPQAVFRRAKQPAELPRDIRLRAIEWALYFAVTGNHSVAELGRRLRAESNETEQALARLVTVGLIEEQELDAAGYLRAAATAGGDDEKSLHDFLIGASAPVEPPPPVKISPRPVRAVPPFKPLPQQVEVKENRMIADKPKLSLRALMNMIEVRATNRDAGQLDIYRVFVRVDTALWKRNGIETLRFSEDRLIADPELEDAIVRSVKKTLGLDCPRELWVA